MKQFIYHPNYNKDVDLSYHIYNDVKKVYLHENIADLGYQIECEYEIVKLKNYENFKGLVKNMLEMCDSFIVFHHEYDMENSFLIINGCNAYKKNLKIFVKTLDKR